MSSILASTLLCFAAAHTVWSTAHRTAAEQRGQWCLAILCFLCAASKLKVAEPEAKEEADSGSSVDRKQYRHVGRRGSSKYRGLSWHKSVGKWAVQLRINGQNQQLGYYSNEEDAAKVYDHYVILTRPAGSPTNFPRPPGGKGYDIDSLASKKRRRGGKFVADRAAAGREAAASQYRGVDYDTTRTLWRATVTLEGKPKWLGFFRSAKDAARAHDQALLESGQLRHVALNFPEEAQTLRSRSGRVPAAATNSDEAGRGSHRTAQTLDEGEFVTAVHEEKRTREHSRLRPHSTFHDADWTPHDGAQASEDRDMPASRFEAHNDSDGLPVPLPRARQRKPDKRKRLDQAGLGMSAEPQLPASGRRGRGRPRGKSRRLAGTGAELLLGDRRKRTRLNPPASKHPISIFTGVTWSLPERRWKAAIKGEDGEMVDLGSFEEEEDAAQAFDQAAIQSGHLKDLNFPDKARMLHSSPESEDEDLAVSGAAALAKFGRVFGRQIAATQDAGDMEWQGEPQRRSRTARGGPFGRKEAIGKGLEGSRARGRGGYMSRGAGPRALVPGRHVGARTQRLVSGHRDVRFEGSSGMWIAELRHHGQTKFIGRFKSEEDASEARDAAGRRIGGPSFPVRQPARLKPFGSGASAADSESSSSEEDDLLPPLPSWGRSVRLATHANRQTYHGTRRHNPSTVRPKEREPVHAQPPVRLAAKQVLKPPVAELVAAAKAAPPKSAPDSSATGLVRKEQLPLPGASRPDSPRGKEPVLGRADLGKRLPMFPSPTPWPSGPAAALPAQKASEAPGPLRLLESGGNLHLASMDAYTRAAVQNAMHLSGSAASSAPAPVQPPPGHLMTLPEKTKRALAAALQQPHKNLTASELLTIIGLSSSSLSPAQPRPKWPTPPPPPSDLILGKQLKNLLSGAAALSRPGEQQDLVSEATRANYVALLQQHTQALTAALARVREPARSYKPSELRELAQAAVTGALPAGLKGPNIPLSLRIPVRLPPASQRPRQPAPEAVKPAATQAFRPVGMSQDAADKLRPVSGPLPHKTAGRGELPAPGNQAALLAAAQQRDSEGASHSPLGSGRPSSVSHASKAQPSSRKPGPPKASVVPLDAESGLFRRSELGLSGGSGLTAFGGAEAERKARGVASDLERSGGAAQLGSSRPQMLVKQVPVWGSRPAPTVVPKGLTRVVSSHNFGAKPSAASVKPSPSRVTSRQPDWPPNFGKRGSAATDKSKLAGESEGPAPPHSEAEARPKTETKAASADALRKKPEKAPPQSDQGHASAQPQGLPAAKTTSGLTNEQRQQLTGSALGSQPAPAGTPASETSKEAARMPQAAAAKAPSEMPAGGGRADAVAVRRDPAVARKFEEADPNSRGSEDTQSTGSRQHQDLVSSRPGQAPALG